jgi:hypothetical protein
VQGTGLLAILFCFGLAGGLVGRIKGSSFFIWFLISFCVPFVGLLTAICYRWEDRELRRPCPSCGRVLKLHDAVCTNCGTELEFPEVALASEAAQRAPVKRMAAPRA